MQLLFVRHGAAEPNPQATETALSRDHLRPLTSAGSEEIRNLARSLTKLLKEPDLIVSSSCIRCLETADILEAELGASQTTQSSLFNPGESCDQQLEWIRLNSDKQLLCLVGHESSLEALTNQLTGSPHNNIFYDHGSACLMDLSSNGQAKIHWSMTPSQLSLL